MPTSSTLLRRSISLTASMSVGALAVVALATNASAEPSCTTDSSGITCSYGGSGSTDIIVPDVNAITLTVTGGGGGNDSGLFDGGTGAKVITTLTVVPCDVLSVYVGGGGGYTGQSGGLGYASGASGGGYGGGGGGSSAILLNGTVSVVAGGGGGGGGGYYNGGAGGAAGVAGGGTYGGSGGSGGSGGAGGNDGWGTAGGNGGGGFAGSGGAGWNQQNGGSDTSGGGGGAGYGGGGGGGYGGGGGGGGSYSSTSATFSGAGNGASNRNGNVAGNGAITLGFDTSAHPCGYIAPVAPVLQEIGLGANANCETLDDTALNWGGAESGNWGTSWAEWPNDHHGGTVCMRTLTYSHTQGHWVSA